MPNVAAETWRLNPPAARQAAIPRRDCSCTREARPSWKEAEGTSGMGRGAAWAGSVHPGSQRARSGQLSGKLSGFQIFTASLELRSQPGKKREECSLGQESWQTIKPSLPPARAARVFSNRELSAVKMMGLEE
jgi:hypothetical protein